MKATFVLLLVIACLAFLVAAKSTKKNATRAPLLIVRKKAKDLKKKTTNSTEESKSASHHVPIVVSPVNVHEAIPVNIDFADGYIHSAANLLHEQGFIPVEARVHDGPALSIQPQLPIGVDVPGLGEHIGDPHQHIDGPYHFGPDSIPIAPEDYYPPDYGDHSAIPGKPGIDYPTYSSPPHTGFKCLAHTATPGFYADVDARCQMWHYCQPDGRHDRFLCPNGTVFDQLTRVCNWWFNVHCGDALSYYDINFDLYREPIKAVPHQHIIPGPSSHVSANFVPHPNSFLKHSQDFQASLIHEHHRHGNDPVRGDDYYHTKHIQAAANPQVFRYPTKMAPQPIVISDNFESLSHAAYDREDASTENHDHKIRLYDAPLKHDSEPTFKTFRKRNRKYSEDNLQDPAYDSSIERGAKPYKVVVHPVREDNGDNIPTYRERKASPPDGRKYRVVKRRKVYRS